MSVFSEPAGLILIPLLLPLLTAALIQIFGRVNDNLRDGLHTTMAALTFASVLRLWPHVKAGDEIAFTLVELFPGVPLAFSVEPLGMLFAMVASGLWILTSIYAFGYMRGHHEGNQTRFFTCFAAAISGALGVAFSANLMSLFVFYEMLTLSTYPLVTHHQDAKAKRAGRIYLGILLTTSVCFLLAGIVWTFSITGNLDFTAGGILADHVGEGGALEGWRLPLLLALFAFGTGKAALMPFHRWLPNAMVAPTPVSALLHAVAVVKAGVFTVLKVVVYIFGIEVLSSTGANDWLMAVAGATLLISSIIALTLDNLKARLAYSTISQLAYIVLGAAMATSAGIMGSAMHIAMHAMGKITLFFCAGAIYVGAHKTLVSQLDGLAKKMPWTMAAFTVGSISIIGLPPMGGSWGKFFLGLGAIQADKPIYLGLLMVSSLLSIGYLMPIVGRAYFRPLDPHDEDHVHEAPWMCVLPLCLTAAGCLVLFLLGDGIYQLILPVVGGAL
ncbi:MAG: monovalent cation/H+ antiporter subunit D family protein [Myxococcota bacterium]|nr:monovalent cation/H+ antiporter subunit D family protein [Myxococcota bacterium]